MRKEYLLLKMVYVIFGDYNTKKLSDKMLFVFAIWIIEKVMCKLL